MFNKTWIISKRQDVLFVSGPGLFSVILVTLLSFFFPEIKKLNIYFIFIFVVFIDISHVYGSLYHSYLNKESFRQNRVLFIVLPVIIFLTLFSVFFFSGPDIFLRLVSYAALFHFIRQQYGIMMMYSRRDNFSRLIDSCIIYMSTIYPIIYWHVYGRNFVWMGKNDFVLTPVVSIEYWAKFLFIISFLVYFFKEFKYKYKNYGQYLFLLSTILVWNVGIVVFNSEVAFAITNIMSHGIPYMYLVWKRDVEEKYNKKYQYPVLVFLIILLALGCLEQVLTMNIDLIGSERFNHFLFSSVYAALSLPQCFHYFLDGVAWKKKSLIFTRDDKIVS